MVGSRAVLIDAKYVHVLILLPDILARLTDSPIFKELFGKLDLFFRRQSQVHD